MSKNRLRGLKVMLSTCEVCWHPFVDLNGQLCIFAAFSDLNCNPQTTFIETLMKSGTWICFACKVAVNFSGESSVTEKVSDIA